MVTDAEAASVLCRGFFYIFLDGELARIASIKALHDWRSQVIKTPESKFRNEILLTQIFMSCLEKKYKDRDHHPTHSFSQSIVRNESHWVLNPLLYLGSWMEFRKIAHLEEFICVLCVRLLSFPEEAVAHGLGVSEGSIRHRLARGLRKLGQIHQPTQTQITSPL